MSKYYSPTVFGRRLEEFLDDYAPNSEGVSQNTIASYCSTFRKYLSWCEQQKGINADSFELKNFTEESVTEFLNWLEQECGVKITTRNQRLSAFHSFCKYLTKREPTHIHKAQQIIAITMKKHPVKQIVDYLTIEEMAAITDSVDVTAVNGLRDAVLIALMYDVVARVQEIADLKIGDVRLYGKDTSYLYITGKGQKTRSVPLSTPSFEMLKEYLCKKGILPKQTPLFVNRNGNKLTRHGISLILKKHVDRARAKHQGLSDKVISPHTLRHSKAMHLLQAGIDLMKIRDMLGHESVVTTEIYARTHDTDLRLALSRVNTLGKTAIPSWRSSPGIMARLASFAKKPTL